MIISSHSEYVIASLEVLKGEVVVGISLIADDTGSVVNVVALLVDRANYHHPVPSYYALQVHLHLL